MRAKREALNPAPKARGEAQVRLRASPRLDRALGTYGKAACLAAADGQRRHSPRQPRPQGAISRMQSTQNHGVDPTCRRVCGSGGGMAACKRVREPRRARREARVTVTRHRDRRRPARPGSRGPLATGPSATSL